MATTDTAAPHRCEFPVQPPHGSFADPGPCACGKTYLAQIAEQRAAEAGLAVVDPADLRWVMGLEPLNTTTVARAQAAHDRLFAIAAGVTR